MGGFLAIGRARFHLLSLRLGRHLVSMRHTLTLTGPQRTRKDDESTGEDPGYRCLYRVTQGQRKRKRKPPKGAGRSGNDLDHGLQTLLPSPKSRSSEKNQALVSEFLATLRVVGLDHPAAKGFGKIKSTQERTGSRQHYDRIEGLGIEDWNRGQRE